MSTKPTIQEEQLEETTLEDEDVNEVASEDVEEQAPVVLERDRVIAEMAKKRRADYQGEAPEESDASDEDEIIDLKVDGEIIPMAKSEVDSRGGIAEVQKTLAAEKRLKEASIYKKQMEQAAQQQRQREEVLRKKELELEARIKAMEEKAIAEPEENEDEIVNKFVQSVYSGDEDEAKQSMLSIMKSLKRGSVAKDTPQINEGDILNRALFEVEKRNGQREFTEKYPHLKQDPFLFDKTNYETVQLMREHPDWSPRDVIIEAASRIDAWYKTQVKPEGATALAEKRQAKQNIETISSAQTRKQANVGYRKQTKDDIFEMYRKTRAK